MQIQFLNVAQWMAGFAASMIAGTNVLVPSFDMQTANDAPQAQKKRRTVVRHIETDGKINEDIDALLKKY
ncbi:MAG TPA: hypothetical protein VEC36_07800, partial [Patescibacteria group bacterium]|nr:hypothetical protein [Patescibacteria group bacterium]